MKILSLNILILTLLSSCASQSLSTTNREPASTPKEMAWGRTVTQDEADFLDDVENSPATTYKGRKFTQNLDENP